MAEVEEPTQENYKLPSKNTMEHACKIAIVEDKPIMLDYWTSSSDKTALIGVRENGEKLLVKSEEEYTSPISKIYKIEKNRIHNYDRKFIYIVSVDIPSKRIS